jgi:hypothetical protein
MTTPQDPARRKKQKRRREKQLANWRAIHPSPVGDASQGDKPAATAATPAAEKPKKKAPAAAKHAG